MKKLVGLIAVFVLLAGACGDDDTKAAEVQRTDTAPKRAR